MTGRHLFSFEFFHEQIRRLKKYSLLSGMLPVSTIGDSG
jgi:hypothetical protein